MAPQIFAFIVSYPRFVHKEWEGEIHGQNNAFSESDVLSCRRILAASQPF